MKKWIGLILLIVIVSFASYYAYQKLHEIKVSSLESMVPEDVMYYVYSYGLDNKIKDLQSGKFIQQFVASPIYNKFIAPRLEAMRNKIPLVYELIQKDVSLAVFSLGNIAPSKTGVLELGDFLFLARIDPNKHITIKKAIADFYLTIASKGKASYKNYKGIKITEYKLPKLNSSVSYALLSDVLAFSNNTNLLFKSIDLYKNQSNSNLLNNKNFQKITSRIKKNSLLWGYSDYRNYYRQILQGYAYDSLRSKDSQDAKFINGFIKMKPFINLMNIFQGYAFYIDYDELRQGLILKSYQIFDRTKDEEKILDVLLYDRQIDKNTFSLIPRYIIGYYGSSQDLLKSWALFKNLYLSFAELTKAEMKTDPRYAMFQDRIDEMSFENTITKINSFLGINIENDLIPILGDNFGIVFAKIDDVAVSTGPTLIFPQAYGFIQLKDSLAMQEIMEAVIQNVVDKANQSFKERQKKFKEQFSQKIPPENQVEPQEEKDFLQLKIDNYKDVNISILEMLNFPLDFFRFNYCILDKYIIFSLSPNLTKDIIDVYKNKQNTFSSNYAFESAQDKLLPNYSNILFFDSKKMIDNFKSTKFFNGLQNQVARRYKNNFSKEDLDSLLSLLGNISAFAFTSRKLDTQTMESNFYIKIEGL